MSRVPLICMIGAACAIVLASAGRWGFPDRSGRPACSACSKKLDAGGFSVAGVSAIRLFDRLSKQRLVSPDDAVLLRLWMTPRTDSAIRFDPASVAPEHEFLLLRCLAISTAADVVASGLWPNEHERGRIWCDLDRLAAGNDEPAIRRTTASALATIAHSESAYSGSAASSLSRFCNDPDPAIQIAAITSLSTPRPGRLHPD